MPDDREIARFSAEQTARFLAGGELGKPEYTDPEIRERVERQRRQLRVGWNLAIGALYEALAEDSPRSAARLLQLKTATLAGDPNAARVLAAMLGELLTQAL